MGLSLPHVKTSLQIYRAPLVGPLCSRFPTTNLSCLPKLKISQMAHRWILEKL